MFLIINRYILLMNNQYYNNVNPQVVTGRNTFQKVHFILQTSDEIQISSADFDCILPNINIFKFYIHINNLKYSYLHA